MSERKIKLDDAMPLIREKLASGGEVTFSPRGTSMLPLLREGRDTVTLSPAPKKLKKYDIPFYQRENGQYVLHRVVKTGESYTCIGDNQFVSEKGVKQEQIIAICTAFTKDGRRYSVNSARWKLYARLWHYSRFPRRMLAALKRRAARSFGKDKNG